MASPDGHYIVCLFLILALRGGMDLSEVIEDAIDHDIRALLEGSSDVGEALNKKLCDTWLKEIGEAAEGDDKK
jgi:hypothetical protein